MATATSAASAREILTGLHDVMASKLGAQAKLNKVVQDHRRGDGERGLLDLSAARRRARAVRHASASTRRRSTSPSSRSARAWSARSPRTSRCSTSPRRPAIPNSPTGPKPARSCSTASPACRSSARERAIGVLAVQHADPRAYDDVEIEALQTVAMVLSELIANAGLADRAAAAGDAAATTGTTRLVGPEAGRRHGARASPSIHQPRIADRAYRRRGYRGRAPPRLFGLRQDARADRRDDGPGRVRHRSASIRRCSRPTRCSPMTKAGRGGSTRRSIPA